MKKIFLSLIILLAIVNTSFAQFQITGKINDNAGETVPFTSVFIKNTTKGVSANVDGIYKFTLEKGDYTLIYRAIGFKTVEKTITVKDNMTVNQSLAAESYTLNNITIRPNTEDPAFEIIRQAIKSKKKHLNEIKSYKTDVYIKGVQKLVGAPKKFFGRDVQKTLDLDTNRKGIIYLSESQSIFSFMRPDKIKEEMVSSKVSGRNNGFSFNKASDMLINFYENLLLQGSGLSARSFVSPIADNGLFYYKYKLLGTTEEDGVTINKIEVIPRRKNDPVFRGIIYIADDSWRIMGTNLYLTEDAGINFVDTLNIGQQFVKAGNVYLPSTIKFEFNGKALGFKFEGYFVGIFSNYDIHPNFPKNYFTAEILKITKTVNKKDSLYWMNNRPIPLTDEETYDYKRKDSISLRKTTKHYLDSTERERNKFSPVRLFLTGYRLNKRYEKNSIFFDPIIKSVFFNTVEGFALKYGISFTQRLEDRKFYTIRPEFRYGFSNHIFTTNISGNYYYDPLKRANISASFGSDIADLNHFGSMSLLSNSINTLLFERNLSKFYKKEFANIATTRELADGLQAVISVDYSKNYTLKNTSNYKIRNLKDKEYTTNNPLAPTVEAPLFPNYSALSISASLTYTIGQKYVTRPDAKIYEDSKYPRFSLGYRKGIKGPLSSDVDYDLLSLEIYQERISMGLFGYVSFVIGAGKFLNNNAVFYPENKHFRGNNSTIFPPNLRKFRYLDFYQHTTDSQYLETHFEHNFAGFLLNKIPLLRKLKFEEVVGINYLTLPGKKNYKEFYFGIQRLGFGVSYGYAYDGNKKVEQGFRIAFIL